MVHADRLPNLRRTALVRIHPTWQLTRKALTATAIAAMVTGGAFLSSGTASASTLLASSCAGSVSGNMGDQIAVQGSTLTDTVTQAAKVKEIFLHLNGVNPDGLGKAIAAKGAFIVGTIPNASGGGIGGDVVATTVVQALQNDSNLGWISGDKQAVLDSIRAAVTKSCGLTALALNYTAPATTTTGDYTPAPGSSSALPGGLLAGNNGAVPQRDYSGIPAAPIPSFAVPPGVRYPAAGGAVPGQPSPEYGLPGDGGATQQQADVRNAGNAAALAAPDSPAGGVQLPMLLAVMALAGVTAALVRTWVLRRVS
jgi:hypothetical protein